MKRNNPLEEKYMCAMVDLLSGICSLPESHSNDPGGFLAGVKAMVGVNPWCWNFGAHLDSAAPLASEKPVG